MLLSKPLFIRVKNLLPMVLSIGIRGIGMLLQFISTIVIARFLGAEQMGIYSVYLASMMVLSGIISLGTPTYAMKQVSILYSQKAYSQIYELLRHLLVLVILATVVALFFYAASYSWLSDVADIKLNPLFIIFAALIFTVLKIINESLKSIGKINFSIFTESALLAALMIGLVSMSHFLEANPVANSIIEINILSMLGVLMVGLYLFYSFVPKQASSIHFKIPKISEFTPYWGNMLIVMGFINAPMLVLPMFASESDVGIFSIAYRLILIMINILGVLAAFFGPKFAIASSQHDHHLAWQLLKRSGLYSLSVFGVLASVLVFFNKPILSLFGEDFLDASLPLFVMLIGQAIYASTGLVGLFLSMTGHARAELKISSICIAIMYAAVFLGGYYFSMIGIAVAFSSVIALKNLLSLFVAHKSVQITQSKE